MSPLKITKVRKDALLFSDADVADAADDAKTVVDIGHMMVLFFMVLLVLLL